MKILSAPSVAGHGRLCKGDVSLFHFQLIHLQVDEMNRRQGQVIEARKRLDEKMKEGEKSEKEWMKIEQDGQDLLADVENISSKFFPIVGRAKGWNSRDLLTRLEDWTNDTLIKSKLILEKFVPILFRIGEFSSAGRSPAERLKAEKLVRALQEKQGSFQVFFLNKVLAKC